jgi:hypothetical protein
MDEQLLLALMGDQSAIQNLDFIRQLIAETRGQPEYADMAKLRMLQGSGMGTDSLTTPKGDE